MNRLWIAVALIFFVLTSPSWAVVDYTQYLAKFEFQLVPEKNQTSLRKNNETTSFEIKTPNGQKGLLHLATPEKIYGEIAYSILSESIGLPNNAKYPVFVVVQNKHPIPLSQINFQDIKIAIYEPSPAFAFSQELKEDTKMLSEHIMHLGLLFLFGATPVPISDNIKYPIQITLGEKDFRSRNKIQNDHYTLSYLPSLTPQESPQLLAQLSEIPITQKYFSSTTQRDLIYYLNTYLSYLEEISAEQVLEILNPLEEATNKKIGEQFLERRHHLREIFYQYLIQLKFNKEFTDDFRYIKTNERPHILIPRPYTMLPKRIDLLNNPIQSLWSLYFEPNPIIKNKFMDYILSEGISHSDLILTAQKSGENFYLVTPLLSQKTQIYDHQTQLNSSRYQTLLVTPLNDQESKFIFHIAKKIGVKSMPLDVPHGYRLSLKHAEHIVEEAKKMSAQTILIVELPGVSSYVEDHIRKSGFNLVIIDHHSYGLDIDRTQRLSSLEQVAQYFGYKLSPKEYIAGIMDRSFIYGLSEIGLEKTEIIDILKSFHQKMQSAGQSIIEEYSRSKKIFFKTESGQVVPIYVIENKKGKLLELVHTAALLEFPEIANVLITNETDEKLSIVFSGNNEIAQKLKMEFQRWKYYPDQYSGGNNRNVGYWGIRIKKKSHSTSRNLLLATVYKLIDTERKHLDLKKTQDALKNQKDIFDRLFDISTVTPLCESYFNI